MSRINIASTNREGYRAVAALDGYVRGALDLELYELVKLRASIVNGCGFCVDMHATDARENGIPERKLAAVAAWQHAGALFDDRERAVFALTDAVTALGPDTVTDEIWNAAATHFDERQLGDLVLAIATINAWNRIAISTRLEPPVDDEQPRA
ncbi:alkyl hydroperoxide reductase AhpD [Pseudoclavibacter endophyticus]|uniref:Carboxymuconolactone decarboxylase family protein n=1 Tax=Pseudoclavibacter endophyticus TaxID=1778590 RepID=A0A6H9WJ93_9MICO|nr:carboxymuconolactone decarboxylase family protein [Pseudoclavibacter endophyticus]KAB1648886.1 carboxymuconolactone decarboxylase family protein [Pseudoclavibacter endophyticus]GGA67512.1 alkyl hydroperoxide reductase AhpD [Pseudoclavibacter endophyticus]